MLVIRHRWKGKCPKHPRYDPRKHGEAAIRGACPTCTLLWMVYAHDRDALKSARLFDEITKPGTAAVFRQIEKAGKGIAAVRSAAARAQVFGPKAL